MEDRTFPKFTPYTYIDSLFDEYLARKIDLLPGMVEKLSSLDLDSLLEDSSITSSKIANILLEQASGGNLVLGGQNNKSGTLTVRDNSDIDRIYMDKDGLTVLNGKATLKDSSNSIFIDSLGLVSLASFVSGTTAYTTNGDVSFTDTSGSWSAWSDLGASLTTNFSLGRQSKVLFYHVGNYALSGDAAADYHKMQVRMLLDTTPIGAIIHLQTESGANLNVPASTYHLTHIATVASGSHTLKAQWRVYRGTAWLLGTTSLGLSAGDKTAELGYLVLGK